MKFRKLLQKKFLPQKKGQLGQEPSQEQLADEVGQSNDETLKSSSYQRSQTYKDKEQETSDFVKKAKRFVPSTRNPLRRFWRRYRLGKILLILLTSFILLATAYLFYLSKTANVTNLQEALKATTVIYDKNGEQAGTLYGQKGTYVELDAISDDLENAVLATEDRSFYQNDGINYKRTLLALLTLGRSGGGSTITQQLAKNAYLTQDQTIKRKAREFFMALELTKKYSKQEILTMYLNNAYFGNGVWGVEDASQKYFGTTAADLSLDQAATLAGMLKEPEIYNPYYSIENATNRRDTVLQNMVAAGMISQEVADETATIGMGNRLADTYTGKVDDYRYPSYFDAVINEAISVYGLKEKDIVNNGYRIYTELDQNYQAGMQTTFNNSSLFPVADDGTTAQAASVALDPKTGGVRGLVGRVNSTIDPTFRSFNYATQSSRSPGSTIKPLVVYTPAVAAGWSLDRNLPNTPMDFNGYQPSNYGGYSSEDVPMYQALANSYNVPAVYIANQLGLDKVFSYGQRFGLNLSKTAQELGVALGGSVTTNPLEMAQAYGAFANSGVMNKAHLITRIETAKGEVIKEYSASAKRVMSKSIADKMTSMMLGTFSNGTAVNANVAGYTLAGKTGTTETEFNPDLASDQWVIGYTPDVVISQWVGFSETDESHYLSDSSAGTASYIFSNLASYILPYTEGNQFTVANAYEQNGIAPVYGSDTATAGNSQSIIDSLQESARQAQENISKVVEDANLAQTAQDVWNKILNYFQ